MRHTDMMPRPSERRRAFRIDPKPIKRTGTKHTLVRHNHRYTVIMPGPTLLKDAAEQVEGHVVESESAMLQVVGREEDKNSVCLVQSVQNVDILE